MPNPDAVKELRNAILSSTKSKSKQGASMGNFEPSSFKPRTQKNADDKDGNAKKKGQRELFLDAASVDELSRDPEGTTYATTIVNGVTQNLAARGRRYREVLRMRVFEATGLGTSAQAEEEGLRTLEARALHEGRIIRPSLRYASHDGAVYVDLGDEKWTTFEITAAGWTESKISPVKFIRTRNMLPMVKPARGGTHEYWSSCMRRLNITDRKYHLLIGAWCVFVIIGVGPYPVITDVGAQGSGKSTRTAFLKRLLDPSVLELRNTPKDENEAFIAAKHSPLICFDNVGRLSAAMSDAFCRIATGGGYGKRELYSNDEENVISVCRPIAMNGITDVITRPDLLDRALLIYSERVQQYRSTDLLKELEGELPILLGFLFDAVAHALNNWDEVKRTKTDLSRMADYHSLGCAVEEFFGFEQGDFDRAYQNNSENTTDVAIQASPLAVLIMDRIDDLTGTYTPTKLLKRLKALCADDHDLLKVLPTAANQLTDRLKRLGPVLYNVGVEFKSHRSNSERWITLAKKDKEAISSD